MERVMYSIVRYHLMYNIPQSRILIVIFTLMIFLSSFLITASAQPDLRGKALNAFQNFTSMNESERMNDAANMTSDEIEMVMTGAAQTNQEVNETIAGMSPQELEKATIILLRFGNFTNQQNGTQVQGLAKILSVNDNQFLRFEHFNITNGPDLHVYITNGKDIKSGKDLGALKGNIGPQNYFLGDFANQYDTVLIASKPFNTIFASSNLKS
jgi:transcriptional regulator of heat shock response